MTVEADLVTALKGLVSNGMYPDVAPENTARPYITYQQVGGAAVNFLDQATVPGKKHSRFQINVWSNTRSEAKAIAIQVEDAVRALTTLQPTVEGAAVAVYEPDTQLRGTHQDFSFLS